MAVRGGQHGLAERQRGIGAQGLLPHRRQRRLRSARGVPHVEAEEGQQALAGEPCGLEVLAEGGQAGVGTALDRRPCRAQAEGPGVGPVDGRHRLALFRVGRRRKPIDEGVGVQPGRQHGGEVDRRLLQLVADDPVRQCAAIGRPSMRWRARATRQSAHPPVVWMRDSINAQPASARPSMNSHAASSAAARRVAHRPDSSRSARSGHPGRRRAPGRAWPRPGPVRPGAAAGWR